jgi:hypothetical protein
MVDVIKWCFELGVCHVSVYAFSLDNFRRDGAEVAGLMRLAAEKFEALAKARAGRGRVWGVGGARGGLGPAARFVWGPWRAAGLWRLGRPSNAWEGGASGAAACEAVGEGPRPEASLTPNVPCRVPHPRPRAAARRRRRTRPRASGAPSCA